MAFGKRTNVAQPISAPAGAKELHWTITNRPVHNVMTLSQVPDIWGFSEVFATSRGACVNIKTDGPLKMYKVFFDWGRGRGFYAKDVDVGGRKRDVLLPKHSCATI